MKKIRLQNTNATLGILLWSVCLIPIFAFMFIFSSGWALIYAIPLGLAIGISSIVIGLRVIIKRQHTYFFEADERGIIFKGKKVCEWEEIEGVDYDIELRASQLGGRRRAEGILYLFIELRSGYRRNLNITATAVNPDVLVKQLEKLRLFYTENISSI